MTTGPSQDDDDNAEPPSLLHCTDDVDGDPVVLIPGDAAIGVAALDRLTNFDAITDGDLNRHRIDLGIVGAVRLGRSLLSYAGMFDPRDIRDLTRQDLEAMKAELARTVEEFGMERD